MDQIFVFKTCDDDSINLIFGLQSKNMGECIIRYLKKQIVTLQKLP